jgi:hypothetical protein
MAMTTEMTSEWNKFWKYYNASPNVNDVEYYEWWRWGQTDDGFFGDDDQQGCHINLQTYIVDTEGKVPLSIESDDPFPDPPELDHVESEAAQADDDRTIEELTDPHPSRKRESHDWNGHGF